MTFVLPTNDILSFWFGDAMESEAALKKQAPLWYSGGSWFDREISQRFGNLFEPAVSHFNSLTAEALPCDQCLAAIILFDQFSRNCFRKTAHAFEFDGLALGILDKALQQKCDECLHPLQCVFLYMPLQHSENIARQDQGVLLFEQLLQRTAGPFQGQVAGSLRFAHLHRDIISEYGRFPHRNAALGRDNTAKELSYLSSGGNRFGQ